NQKRAAEMVIGGALLHAFAPLLPGVAPHLPCPGPLTLRSGLRMIAMRAIVRIARNVGDKQTGKRMTEFDLVVLGGGLGGVAAVLAAARLGQRSALVSESDWTGGQVSSQCIPPDEHPWIESVGCTRSYREFRDRVRRFYR